MYLKADPPVFSTSTYNILKVKSLNYLKNESQIKYSTSGILKYLHILKYQDYYYLLIN